MATIAENLTKLSTSIENAYNAIDDMSGDLPSDKRAANLATAIRSIPTGGGESEKYGVSLSAYLGEVTSGTYNRPTANATFRFSGLSNVAAYALSYHLARHSSDTTKKRDIVVNFPDLTSTNSYSLYYFGYQNRDIIETNFSALTSTGSYGLQYAFYYNSNISAIDFSNLRTTGTYGLHYAYYYCSKISSADYPNLSSIPSYGLQYTHGYNTSLTSFNLSALKTVGSGALAQTFAGCSKLSSAEYPSLSAITGSYGLSGTHYNNTSLTSFNLSALTMISAASYGLYSTFQSCSKLSAADFPNLSGYIPSYGFYRTFYNNTSLLSATFPNISAIGSGTSYTYEFAQTFYGCTKLSSIDFSNLKFIGGNYALCACFYNCSALTSIEFPELTGISAATSYSYGTFYQNNCVKDIYFPKLSAINNTYMFYTSGNAQLTGVHFAKVNEAAISATTGYASKWGKSSGLSVFFDLNTDGTAWSGVDGEEY